MMSKVVNLEDYKKLKFSVTNDDYANLLFELNRKIVDLHEKSVINYEEYKILLNKLNQIVNDKGDKDE